MKFAYLFARFPSLTQTFCFREVEEMRNQMGEMPIWSLRYPTDFSTDCPKELAACVQYIPEHDDLRHELGSVRRTIGRFSPSIVWQVKRFGKGKGKYRLYEAAWLGRELKKQGVTHIHTHFAGTGARTAWWIQRLYGITYSFTGHANDMFCVNDDPIPLSRLVADAAFVATVSNFSKLWLHDQFPMYASKIYRVYNGMKLSSLPESDQCSKTPLILSVGRAIEKKGFSDLLDACACLQRDGIDFKCQIVGGGPLEPILRQQIQDLGLNSQVEILGSLPLAVVRKKLQEASVFVLPCVAETGGGMDNLPTVILEAMEASLPVVSTHVAAVPEMVQNGKTGLLVDEHHPQQLARALRELLLDPDQRKRMGASGRQFAEQHFAVDVTVAQLRQHLLQVL